MGSCRHFPGSLLVRNSMPTRGSTRCEPSLARAARIAAAARFPNAIPLFFVRPSRISANSSVRTASNRSACEGKSAVSVSCAACATAASSDVPSFDGPTFYGIHDFEDRQMDDGHRPARSARAELFAEDAGNRCVIEPAGIDRNLIPMANAGCSIEPVAGTMSYIRFINAGVRLKSWAERILNPHLANLPQKTLAETTTEIGTQRPSLPSRPSYNSSPHASQRQASGRGPLRERHNDRRKFNTCCLSISLSRLNCATT